MATVRRIAKGRYIVSVQIDGKQTRKVFSTRAEADAWRLHVERDLREQRLSGLTPRTFGQVAREYLADRAIKGKRTVNEDRAALENYLVPFFGAETKVSEITTQEIARFEQRQAREVHPRLGRPVSPARINRNLALLRGVLRFARRLGYLREVPQIQMARESEGRLRYLTPAEAECLLAACRRSKSPYLWIVVTIALNTGMRRGEILGLAWERVDFERRVLRLEQSKSGRRREVPTNDSVYEALMSLAGRKAEGPVFRKKDGSPWGNIRTAFERACREADLKDFRFHDLRHTCASWLVMAGRSLKEVQELLGHQTFTMTLRYAHLNPDRLREAVASLEGFSSRP